MRMVWLVGWMLVLSAGCLDKSGAGTAEGSGEGAQGPVGPSIGNRSVTDFERSGYLPGGASAPGVATVGILVGDRWFPTPINGTVQDVELTMTWSPESPVTETLAVAFGQLERDGSREYTEVYEHVVGTSPLTLSLEGLDWNTEDYVVWAWYDTSQPAGGSIEQSFAIEGTIVSFA